MLKLLEKYKCYLKKLTANGNKKRHFNMGKNLVQHKIRPTAKSVIALKYNFENLDFDTSGTVEPFSEEVQYLKFVKYVNKFRVGEKLPTRKQIEIDLNFDTKLRKKLSLKALEDGVFLRPRNNMGDVIPNQYIFNLDFSQHKVNICQ